MPSDSAETQDALQLLRDVLASRPDRPAGPLTLSARSLKGGLTANLLCVSARTNEGRLEQFVLKRLPDRARQEARAYAALARCGLSHIGPRLLATPSRGGTRYLLLEFVPRWKTWPWRDEAYAGMVLDTLARLHAAPLPARWRADSPLQQTSALAACYTCDLLCRAAAASGEGRLRRGVRVVEALAARLPEARARLHHTPVFLHGDVHPGNVFIRAEEGRRRAVLVDWGRSRLGSRFEDVASWLQCLRYFERATIAAHDRLLLRYIRAAGLGDRITAALRREYWMAAGSNGLAGALGVHLSRMLNAKTAGRRDAALAAAVDWLRIIRRAAAYLDAE